MIKIIKNATSETHDFPIDIESLEKGDVIDAKVTTRFLGTTQGTNEHSLAILNLKTGIETNLKNLNRAFILRVRQDGIAVLTDQEAAGYTSRKFRSGFLTLNRIHRKAKTIDKNNLEPDEVRSHEHALLVQGAMLVAATRARVEVTSEPHKRNTPGLFVGKPVATG